MKIMSQFSLNKKDGYDIGRTSRLHDCFIMCYCFKDIYVCICICYLATTMNCQNQLKSFPVAFSSVMVVVYCSVTPCAMDVNEVASFHWRTTSRRIIWFWRRSCPTYIQRLSDKEYIKFLWIPYYGTTLQCINDRKWLSLYLLAYDIWRWVW